MNFIVSSDCFYPLSGRNTNIFWTESENFFEYAFASLTKASIKIMKKFQPGKTPTFIYETKIKKTT